MSLPRLFIGVNSTIRKKGLLGESMRIAKKVRKGLVNFVHILYVFLFVWMCKKGTERIG